MKTLVLSLLSLLLLSACAPSFAPAKNEIAYIGRNGDLFTIQATGDLPRQITTDGAGYRHPIWSRNGARLAFLNNDGTAILVASAGGEWFHQIYRSQIERPLHLGWSPDGKRLAFTSTAAGGAQLLHVIAVQTEALRTLDAGRHLRWEWTGDGEVLVQTDSHRNRINVNGVVLEESLVENGVRPPDPPGPPLNIRLLSPDGQSVARVFEDEEGVVLSVANPWSGLERRRYKINPTQQTLDLLQRLDGWHEGFRLWSPDSRYIALAHVGEDGPAIWIYPTTGNQPARQLVEGLEASWSWR
jgi:Tol biopolymer transport system component